MVILSGWRLQEARTGSNHGWGRAGRKRLHCFESNLFDLLQNFDHFINGALTFFVVHIIEEPENFYGVGHHRTDLPVLLASDNVIEGYFKKNWPA